MKRYLLAGLVLLVFAGCTQEEEYEFQPEPNILALMHVVPFEAHRIWVDQTYDIRDTVDQNGVRGCEVFLHGYVGEEFFDVGRGKYISMWTAPLSDTILYQLEVIMPWDDTVTAEAYMPTPIRIHTPADSDTVSISAQPVSPHIVTWNPCKNTELYLIYCIPDVDTSELDNISPIFTLPSFTMDTSYTFFLQRMIAPWDFDMHYVLRVIAVSPEYADYMGMQGPGTSVSNLSSGYGMFGGTSEDSIRVYITE
jgi:hypothetical protein